MAQYAPNCFTAYTSPARACKPLRIRPLIQLCVCGREGERLRLILFQHFICWQCAGFLSWVFGTVGKPPQVNNNQHYLFFTTLPFNQQTHTHPRSLIDVLLMCFYNVISTFQQYDMQLQHLLIFFFFFTKCNTMLFFRLFSNVL